MKTNRIITAALIAAQLGFVSVKAQGLLTNLQACYPLDGNVTNMAATGSPLDGTPVNVTPATGHTGFANTAYAFAGNVNSYIQLPNDYRIKPDTISFSGWVLFKDTLARQYVVYTKNTCMYYFEGYTLHGEPTSGGYKLMLVKSSSACSPATEEVLTSVGTINKNQWYHVGFYIGNDSLKLYIDGMLDNSMPSAVNFDYDPNGFVYLGGTNVWYFNMPLAGLMDNVRFYNRKLTDQEMYILYNRDPDCRQSWCADPNCTRYLPKTGSTVGLNQNSAVAFVELFPNPGNGKLFLRSEEPVAIEIFDITGKAVNYTRTNLDATTDEIVLTEKNPGIYLTRIYDSSGALVQTSKIAVTD